MALRQALIGLYHLRRNALLAYHGNHIDLSSIRVDRSSRLVIRPCIRIARSSIVVGRNSTVSIASGATITGAHIVVGDDCRVVLGDRFLLQDAMLHVTAGASVSFGADCLLATLPQTVPAALWIAGGSLEAGVNVNLKGKVVVRRGELTFGSNCFINHGSEIRCENRVEIGDYVSISYFVDIFDTNTHSTDWRARRQETDDGFPHDTDPRNIDPPKTAPIRVGNDVWIGKWAAVMKGCDIGARSIIGMRAVVVRSCPEDSLLAGNPATIRPLSR